MKMEKHRFLLKLSSAYIIKFAICGSHYRAWLQYYLNRKLKKTKISGKMLKAATHHSQRLMKEHFIVWKVCTCIYEMINSS